MKTKLSTRTRTKLKLVSLISVSAFSLVAVVTACLAWFSNNKNTDGNGISGDINTDIHGSFSALSLHRCRTNESNDEILKFYSEVANPNGESVFLEYYSELSTTQPILLLFKMQDGGVDPATVRLSVQTTLTTPEACTDIELDDTTAPNYYDNFSFCSAVQFKVIAYHNDFSFDNFVLADAEVDSFVTLNGDNDLIWKHTDNNGNAAGFDLFDGSDEPSTPLITHLAVVMDYYSEAINSIFDASEETADLSFVCDFKFLIS